MHRSGSISCHCSPCRKPMKLNRWASMGRMRLAYLKTQRPVLYNQMLMNGTLWPHLQEVQKAACACLERTVVGLLDQYPAPNKERAQLSWVAHMNGLKAQAEEMVLREIVYAE